jgi:cytochrome b561
MTLVYAARKKFRGLSKIGTTKTWLEIHIFCGLVGPVLVTLHTAMKFNGVVSIAYWSMVLVVLSGFVGRYLYVRIPKTLRGTELSLEELDARAIELKGQLAAEGLPTPLLRRIEGLEQGSRTSGFLLGDFALGRRLAKLHGELAAAGIAPTRLVAADRLIRERAMLLRRIATLDTSRKLFHLWHVFHKPFVYVMLAIAAVHVAVALYFGYAGSW